MSTPDAFDRLTTRIGDLDHPLYAEERQRGQRVGRQGSYGNRRVLQPLLAALGGNHDVAKLVLALPLRDRRFG